MNRRPILTAAILALFAGFAAPASAEIRVLDPDYRAEVILPATPLRGANGATIGPDGALYVTQVSAQAVSRIDLATRELRPLIEPWAGVCLPDDIASDGEKWLFVTGTTPRVGEVYRIGLDGSVKVIAGGLAAPNGVEYDRRRGRLFVSECFWGSKLYEIDPNGARPPRVILADGVLQVPEGFGIDADGSLIIPDLGTGKIVRVNPDSGAVSPIAEGYTTPVGLDLGPDGKFYVAELATGIVWRGALDGSGKEKLAQLPPGLDNLALTPEGRLFVTSFHNATVYEVLADGSGKFETLFTPGINTPSGIAVAENRVYVADAIMVRALGGNRAAEPTKLNAWFSPGMPIPLGLCPAGAGKLAWPDWINNEIALGDPATGEFKVLAHADAPIALAAGPQGTIYAALHAEGKIISVNLASGATASVAEGLDRPIALALSSAGTELYAAEAGTGRIHKIDPRTGDRSIFLSGGVGRPAGLALDDEDRLLILDSGGRRVLRVGLGAHAKSGELVTLADNLPVASITIGAKNPIEFPIPIATDATGDLWIACPDGSVAVLKRR